MPLELLHLLMLAASLLLMLHKGMVILRTLSRVAGSKLMITLVIRSKGCLTRSSLDMISRTMGHRSAANSTQGGGTAPSYGGPGQQASIPATGGQPGYPNQPPILLLLHQATRRKVLPLKTGYVAAQTHPGYDMQPPPQATYGQDAYG
uniref:Uncharacterized protein n=1 Tax=Aegilops tauschii TaxID=37682 RepID=R7WFU8_AEGTA